MQASPDGDRVKPEAQSILHFPFSQEAPETLGIAVQSTPGDAELFGEVVEHPPPSIHTEYEISTR